MSTIEMKYKAFELLMNTNNDSVLQEVMNVLLKSPSVDVSEELKETLDSRREKYLNGESNTYSWQEVKTKARNSA